MLSFLAQYQSSGGDEAAGAAGCAACGGCGLFMILYLAVLVAVVIGFWKVFVKAGKPGWASIVPIYQLIILVEIAEKPIWWIAFFLVPPLGFILTGLEIAKRFGKSQGFGIGLGLLPMIFYPILGFGSAQYQRGPAQPSV